MSSSETSRVTASDVSQGLLGWSLLRIILILFLLALSIAFWRLDQSSTDKYNRWKKFGIGSQAKIIDVDGQDNDLYIKFRAYGKDVSAWVSPKRRERWVVGEFVPIVYDRHHPTTVAYDGPGGDIVLNDAGPVRFDGAIVFLCILSVVIMVQTTNRWQSLLRTTKLESESNPLVVQISGKKARALGAWHGRDLRWRLLSHQQSEERQIRVQILGAVAPGSWLVLRHGDELLWPASSARRDRYASISAVAGASTPPLQELRAAHTSVLRAYATTRVEIDNAQMAPASMLSVRGLATFLVKTHIHHKLKEIASSYVRLATLWPTKDVGAEHAKSWLATAGQECNDLRAAITDTGTGLNRAKVIGLAIAQALAAAVGAAIVAALVVQVAKLLGDLLNRDFDLSYRWVYFVVLLAASFGGAELFRFAFELKREWLFPGSSSDRLSASSTKTGRNCYEVEDRLFALLRQLKRLEVPRDFHVWLTVSGFWALVGISLMLRHAMQAGSAIGWILHVAVAVLVYFLWRRIFLTRRAALIARNWI